MFQDKCGDIRHVTIYRGLNYHNYIHIAYGGFIFTIAMGLLLDT